MTRAEPTDIQTLTDDFGRTARNTDELFAFVGAVSRLQRDGEGCVTNFDDVHHAYVANLQQRQENAPQVGGEKQEKLPDMLAQFGAEYRHVLFPNQLNAQENF